MISGVVTWACGSAESAPNGGTSGSELTVSYTGVKVTAAFLERVTHSP